MNKLKGIREEFEEFQETTLEKNEEALRKQLEAVENYKLSDDQEKQLEQLKELTGIEVDGSDIYETLTQLKDAFNVRDIAEPAKQISQSAMEQACAMFALEFELDEEEYPVDRISTIINEAAEFFKDHFGMTERDLEDKRFIQKIAMDAGLFHKLPKDFKSILFGDSVMVDLNKYQRLMIKAMPAIAAVFMQDSLDAFIEEENMKFEIFALQEKKLQEATANLKASGDSSKDILVNIIEDVKNFQPNIKVLDNNNFIRTNYIRKIRSLEMISELLESDIVNEENEKLKVAIEKQVSDYRAKAESLRRVVDLDFIKPIKGYMESGKGDKAKLTKDLAKQLELYVHRVAKYKFSVPLPGYDESCKTFSDLKNAMASYYALAFENYYTNRDRILQDNPEMDLPTFTQMTFYDDGAPNYQKAGSIFSFFVLLTLSRYDKKFMKHVDFKRDKIKMLEYYLSYELLSSLDKDTYTFARIIKEANELME
jgi:hypothetical protein